MALNPVQQVIDKITSSNNILIVLPQESSGDTVGSALALKSFLNKLDKEATIVSPANLNQRFKFLPGFSEIQTKLNLSKSFVIDLSTKRTQVEELSYKKDADKLSIYIKPKENQFEPTDVTFRSSNLPYELVIALGVSSLDELGDFYNKNTDLFFETPLINIDHKPTNENFGQINLLNLSATSASEIVFDLINKFESSLMDETIATNLLAGIITETNSFQHARTTPMAFLKASQLVNMGGRQQDIINEIYKSKSIGFLKLWGRVLARLKQESDLMLAYSVATISDIEKSQAIQSDVAVIIKEMSSQLGFAKTFIFLVEMSSAETEVYGATQTPWNLLDLFAKYKPEAIGSMVKFRILENLNAAEKQVVDIIRQYSGKS